MSGRDLIALYVSILMLATIAVVVAVVVISELL